MSAPPPGPDPAEQLNLLRALVVTATQRLLGDTIAVSDEAWAQPSRLPGWSRGYVATHLARQADAFGRLAGWAVTGERQDMYPSSEARMADIEAGGGRTGLELQVDLDASASALEAAFERVEEAHAWGHEVEVRGGLRLPARLLPLGRLFEVVVHHADLDVGYGIDDIEAATAEWLLEWCAFRLRVRDEFPRLTLRSDSGFTVAVGSAGGPFVVTGSSPAMLGWLLGRTDGSSVRGGDGLRLPSI